MIEQQPTAFFSYARWDDEHDGGYLSQFRQHLADEVQAQTGVAFPIFQDQIDVAWGQDWQQRITGSLNETVFFIPVLTPTFFTRPACREELTLFLEREKAQGRGDLILPIYYISCSVLDDEGERAGDPLAQALHARQFADWRALRHQSLQGVKVMRRIEDLARQIQAAQRRVNATRMKAATPTAALFSSENPQIQSQEAKSRAHFDRGVTLRGMGDLAGAAAEFRKYLALNPDSAYAHYDLGIMFMDQEDFVQAAEQFQQAVALNSSDADLYYNLGLALHKKVDADGAIAEYRQALSLEPNYVDAHNNIGILLWQQGDFDGAAVEFRQTIALEPNNASAHMRLASVFWKQAELDSAISEYLQALTLNPNEPQAHYLLGMTYWRKHDARAIDEFRKAIAQDPGDVNARDSLDTLLGRKSGEAGIISP